jgi:hypothetical protein
MFLKASFPKEHIGEHTFWQLVKDHADGNENTGESAHRGGRDCSH